jgi:hypothetical protein
LSPQDGDDVATGGAGDEIERVVEAKIRLVSIAFLQDPLDALQKTEPDQAAHPSPIQGKDALRSTSSEMGLQAGGLAVHSLDQHNRVCGEHQVVIL